MSAEGGDDALQVGAPAALAPEPEAAAALGDAALRARADRVERKPPAYRVFRVTLYSLYGLVAAWLVGTITVAVWQSVYGDAGQALRATVAAPLAPGVAPAAAP